MGADGYQFEYQPIFVSAAPGEISHAIMVLQINTLAEKVVVNIHFDHIHIPRAVRMAVGGNRVGAAINALRVIPITDADAIDPPFLHRHGQDNDKQQLDE